MFNSGLVVKVRVTKIAKKLFRNRFLSMIQAQLDLILPGCPFLPLNWSPRMKAKMIKIGRGEKNDIVLKDPSISRKHLELFRDEEGNVFITDLNSSNGTRINGKRLKDSLKLSSNDIVKAGNVLLPWKNYFAAEESEVDDHLEEDYVYSEEYVDEEIESSPNGFWGLVILVGICVGGYFLYQGNSGSTPSPSNGKTISSKQPIDNSGSSEQTKKPLTTWGCSQCAQVKYAYRSPDVHNCPVGYVYNGGSGSSHSWINYGKQGQESFSCFACGLNVQVAKKPDVRGCRYHEYGQAWGTSHHWQ
jgi:pSer/pThr/pTyr-binding forkhead associated (FHA) protein